VRQFGMQDANPMGAFSGVRPSVFGARYSALGVDSVPGIGSPGTGYPGRGRAIGQ